MAKRKRNLDAESTTSPTNVMSKRPRASARPIPASSATVQIIAGSYDRVLHGITVTITSEDKAEFADTFLFNAHESAIRCLALSPLSVPVPKQTQKVLLATGSTDERINLYQLSAHAPAHITVPAIDSLKIKAAVENPQNKELGSLTQHRSSVTSLYFPNRSKLLSGSDDNTIAVTRTRDWNQLSEIKVPVPKQEGRPSGDTAPLGAAPSGINDFAVHPSMKLMITVGKGEKIMRLWNLITGKRAGVLQFEKEMLNQVGEGKFASGEGRKVAWGSTDAGEEFCVTFDRGALVFGMDCKPKCRLYPQPRDKKHQSKIHQIAYVQADAKKDVQILALSTEDGRILFYSTRKEDLIRSPTEKAKDTPIPSAKMVACLDSKDSQMAKAVKDEKVPRIKDFTAFHISEGEKKFIIIATGRSDGVVQLFKISAFDLIAKSDEVRNIGKLLGTYATGNRITCIAGFLMLPKFEGDSVAELEDDFEGFENDEEDGGDDSDSE